MKSDKLEISHEILDLGRLRTIGKSGPEGFSDRVSYVHALPSNRIHSKRIVILSTLRSGSTFLCDQIASTGLVGAPDEWLNPFWIEAICRAKYASNVVDALDWVACRTATNGIFSINLQLPHYIHWKKNGFDFLKWGFNEAIYLEREDKISQAYSLAKARIYNKWEQTSSSEVLNEDEKPIPIYAILKALSDIYFWSECYEKVFKTHTSKTISYEDCLSNQQLISDLIFQFSGTRLDALPIKSILQKQQTSKDRDAIELLKTKIRL